MFQEWQTTEYIVYAVIIIVCMVSIVYNLREDNE